MGFLLKKDSKKFAKKSSKASSPATGGTASRPASPNAGDFRFNSDTNKVEYYDSSAWQNLSRSGNAAISKTTVVTGDGTTTAFTNFFTTAPSDENNVLVVVGNVIQEPDAAYTISGRDITFTSPPPNTHRIYAIEGLDATDIA
jgi:hypothetical protein